MTLCPCLVNTAGAILAVFTSTHFVSRTTQWEETGFHFSTPPPQNPPPAPPLRPRLDPAPPSVFEEAVFAVAGWILCFVFLARQLFVTRRLFYDELVVSLFA